jgi:hypothetical protein
MRCAWSCCETKSVHLEVCCEPEFGKTGAIYVHIGIPTRGAGLETVMVTELNGNSRCDEARL